jgi:hypothetical protein
VYKINANKQELLSLDRLKYLLNYSPDTGLFIYNVSQGSRGKGSVAGNLQTNGYRQIRIDKRLYLEHRLAWFYCFQEWPIKVLDHINGIKDDNRLDNLREVSQSQNLQNSGLASHNTSGYRGVSYVKSRNKFEAYISIDNIKKNLGHFNTAEEAHSAYLNAVSNIRKEYLYENSNH